MEVLLPGTELRVESRYKTREIQRNFSCYTISYDQIVEVVDDGLAVVVLASVKKVTIKLLSGAEFGEKKAYDYSETYRVDKFKSNKPYVALKKDSVLFMDTLRLFKQLKMTAVKKKRDSFA